MGACKCRLHRYDRMNATALTDGADARARRRSIAAVNQGVFRPRCGRARRRRNFRLEQIFFRNCELSRSLCVAMPGFFLIGCAVLSTACDARRRRAATPRCVFSRWVRKVIARCERAAARRMRASIASGAVLQARNIAQGRSAAEDCMARVQLLLARRRARRPGRSNAACLKSGGR